MTPQKLLAAVVALCFISLPVTCSAGCYEVARFEPGEVFSHLAWNTETQQLYVGAVNTIYRLEENLQEIQKSVTGPKLDNPNCPPTGSDIKSKCMYSRTDTDAVNKILVIDYMNQRLIACFNLYHGYCDKFHLEDLSQKDEITLRPIVSNIVNGSSFAFIAPGRPDQTGALQPEVLYVSASWSTQGLKVFRDQIPAFCSRNLDTFKLAYKKFRKSSIEIESQQRDTFPVRYIYGFPSGKFSYMLTVQKKGAQLDNFISKIFRVCQNDPKFYSYAEVELKCMHQQTHYNILQAAYVGKAGKNLAQGLRIPTVEDVLYAVFSLGESNSDTALCIYPLRTIRKMFTKNIKMCFEGVGNTGPDHIVAPASCAKTYFNITDDYCGEHDINNPIDGTQPIEANAALRFGSHTKVSAIMVAITHDYTVAFVGTTKGHLIKVTIEGHEEASVYENISVQEGSMVNPDLRMDNKKLHLFVMTEKRLTKLKVQDCQHFKTCGECLGAKDPYCGWCSLENKCSLKEECNQYDMTMRWLPYSGQQCTNLTRVVPDKIQKDHRSKTHPLELVIQNLPDFPGTYECAFSYDKHFVPIITLANKTVKSGKPLGVSCQTPLPNQLPMVPTGQATPPTGGPTAPSSGFVERNDLDCSAGLMHIHLPLSLFPTHKVTLRDPSCNVPSNGTHLVIDISLNQCGTTVTFTNDSVVFKNDLVATVVVTGSTAASIIDYGLNKDDQRVPVSCEFPRQSRVDFGYMPLQRKAHFYEKQYGHLDFEVKHYKTAQFSTLIPHNGMPVGVALNTEVFIDIAVDHKSNKGVGIFVDSCIATPTTSPADPLWYPLIKDGCPMQTDVKTFTAPDISDFRFSFLAFKFTNAPLHHVDPSMPASPMVYLHCQVSACPTGNCTTSCHSQSARTRRSAEPQNSHLISTGPFYLKPDDHDSTGYSGGVVAGTMSVAAVATLVAMVALVAWRRSANKLSRYQATSMEATS